MVVWYEPLYQYYLGHFDEIYEQTEEEWDE